MGSGLNFHMQLRYNLVPCWFEIMIKEKLQLSMKIKKKLKKNATVLVFGCKT